MLGAVLVAALALAACSPGESRAEQSFHLSGSVLFRGSQRFVVHGTVDYVLPFYDAPGGGPDASLAKATSQNFAGEKAAFAAMRRDGINLVRIPVGLPGYEGNVYRIGGPAGYIRRLTQTVRAAEAAHLAVVLCWWDSLGWGAQLSSHYEDLWPMARAVVRAIGSDPDVIYEPFNEPNGISWSQWETVMEQTLREWRQALGYRGVLLLDTINYSWSFSPAAATSLQRADGALLKGAPEILFSNHRYPDGANCFCGSDVADFEQGVTRYASEYPILGGEYGIFVQGYSPNLSWIAQFLPETRRLEGADFNGAILFVWSWVDANTLTAGPKFNLTPYGQVGRRELWDAAA